MCKQSIAHDVVGIYENGKKAQRRSRKCVESHLHKYI